MDYYINPVDEETDFLKIAHPEEFKVIDPACGSGHMLTYAFDLLYAIYEEEGYAPTAIPGLILANNLHGTEIAPRAGALAAFALTMKARAKQRTFFNNKIEPKICVIEPISFSASELDVLAGGVGDPAKDGVFWNQFEHADLLGSLIQPDRNEADRLARLLETVDDAGDMLKADTIERAHSVVKQADYLSRRYSVVVANPPYMGSAKMDPMLSAFAKRCFPASKADLFAMFLERCLALVCDRGAVAMITMQSWMFLSSFEKLREQILEHSPIHSMAHLGSGAFETIGGDVVSTVAFVLVKGGDKSQRGSYFRLVDLQLSHKTAALQSGAAAPDFVERYEVAPVEFAGIPGSPVAYWLDPALIANYREGRLLGDLSYPRKGIDTGENAEFLRMWWEVNRSDFSAHCEPGRKWFPYNKGGGFRRWYGNREVVVNWALDGAEIRSRLNWSSKKPTLRNRDYMTRKGFTWSKIASGGFSARYTPEGALFDNGGSTLFADLDLDLDRFGALVNSSTADLYLQFLAPTINIQPGDVANIPVPRGFDRAEVSSRRCVEIARDDWNSSEESFDFQRLEIIGLSQDISIAVNEALVSGQSLVSEIRGIEQQNNSRIADAYGLSGLVAKDVPLEKVALSCNPPFRFGPGLESAEYAARMRTELIAELISYAVGCMFGRYSLDAPGLILANQGATLAGLPRPRAVPQLSCRTKTTSSPSWTQTGSPTTSSIASGCSCAPPLARCISARTCDITESLGGKDIRKYFAKSFYADHVKRYKKRPIYWMFSSPKGSVQRPHLHAPIHAIDRVDGTERVPPRVSSQAESEPGARGAVQQRQGSRSASQGAVGAGRVRARRALPIGLAEHRHRPRRRRQGELSEVRRRPRTDIRGQYMTAIASLKPHLERRFADYRIVFWHDPEGQYGSDLDSLDLPGVTTVRIADDEFAVKNRLLHDQPTDKFLVALGSALVDTLNDGKRISL